MAGRQHLSRGYIQLLQDTHVPAVISPTGRFTNNPCYSRKARPKRRLDLMLKPAPETKYESHLLEYLFNTQFNEKYKTQLCGGSEQPLYQLAPQAGQLNTIFYTRDYFASALHEVAHWCVAGQQRRQQEDYGYWYAPDGRSVEQQLDFERVEVKPQALEWLFSSACGFRFRVSADNLNLGCGPSETFKLNITEQVKRYLDTGLPLRAGRFCAVLSNHFGGEYLDASRYCAQLLD